MRISRYRSAVLFDALVYYAVRHGEHLIYKVGEAFVFDVTLGILGGRFRVGRHDTRSVPCRALKVKPFRR